MACLLQADLEEENTDIVLQNNLLFPKIGLSIYLLRWPLLLYWTSYIFYLHKRSSEAGKYYHLSVTNEEQE